MRRAALLVSLVLFAACRTPGKDAPAALADGVDAAEDSDRDGFFAEDDCNDQDAQINTGAVEVCDGVDNDCDGQIDEDVTERWYDDADGDGYGDVDAPGEGCAPPADSARVAGDCDDDDPLVFPSAPERCDGRDQDCDGEVDEDVATVWYADADADGFGDASRTTADCDPGAGWVADATDCDDADASASPIGDEICDERDNDCDGAIDEDIADTWYADRDGDGWGTLAETVEACSPPAGYAADTGDCADDDPAVHPAATEICDSQDNDCDGDIDEGVSLTWYTDSDTDGWGDVAAATSACTAPAGTTATPGDCDDSSALVSPSASELCDGLDNDCDGTADEDGRLSWYADADADGYGTGTPTVSCAAPAGSVAQDGDCDDASAAVHPGASELCNRIDDDCDGLTDDADPSVDLAGATAWSTDADRDGYGAGRSTRACTAPTGTVAAAGDCDDSAAAVNPAAAEVCNSIDDDCDGLADDADPGLDRSTASTWVRDADGDGWGASGAATTTACAAPPGAAARAGDCDDGDRTVNPGASETCDGYDEDCDRAADEGGVCPCAVVADPADALHVYQLCTTPSDWVSARDTCRATGYELVTINDAAENSFVDGQADARSTDRWWIGFNDISSEGAWTWASGQPVTYAPWGGGEPNNGGGNEDCGQINRFHPALTWNDEPCSTGYPYICEAGD